MYDFDWSSIVPSMPYLLAGLVITLKITVIAIVVGIVWGTLLAVMRLSSFMPLAWFAKSYVNVFRSIPLVMVLLWFYLIVPGFLQNVLGLSPKTDIRLISAMVAFSMFEAAYYSEIIRAGIQSISRGQSSAALALGMTHWQSMRLVILPLLALGVCMLMRLDSGVTLAVVIAASTPPAALLGMFAAKFDKDVSLAPSLVAVQTLLSMITMPLVLGLAKFLV